VRAPRLLLLDMCDAIDDVFSCAAGGRAEFMASRKTQAAVIRCFEIIGEAAKTLPDAFKPQASHIPWKRIAGFRDVLAHAYHRVDIELVWQVVEDDLPALREQIAGLIEHQG
jgi:uncharacterized protein with HEPN domain